MQKLDKKVRTLWLLRNMFIIFPTIIIYLLIIFSVEECKIVLALSFGFLTIIIIGLAIIWPILSYRYYSYDYDDKKIYINRGIIFQHKIVIPVRQIQDLHLYNGPFMQIFKLGGVIISTAGSNFILSGINKGKADKMLYELEERLESRLDSDEEVY